MEELSSLKITKIRSPKKKIKNNPLFKSLKSEIKEKKITIKSNRKSKTKSEGFIPTELSFKKTPLPKSLPSIKSDPNTDPVLVPNPVPNSVPNPVPVPNPVKSSPLPKKNKKRKITQRIRKPVNPNKYKDKTISVRMKKKKENDINKLIKQFDNLKLPDIQSKLKSKGIDTKNKDKNKLLKYIYLLTCVDDNINLIKN
jgi:hypothetical protein